MKFDSDDELPKKKKMVEIPIMTIVVRAVFLENKKILPTDFLRLISA